MEVAIAEMRKCICKREQSKRWKEKLKEEKEGEK